MGSGPIPTRQFRSSGGFSPAFGNPAWTRIVSRLIRCSHHQRKVTMKQNVVLNVAVLTTALILGGGLDTGAQLSLTNFTSGDVGNPILAGSSIATSNNFDVTGAGSDIGGTNDQFQFNYQQFAGDFDVRGRV